MECISELKDSLNMYFGWNKARMTCFVNMLLALLAIAFTWAHRTGEWQNEQNNPQWLDLGIGLF